MIIPYELEDSRISRIPWTSIGLVATILIGFFVASPGASDDAEVDERALALVEHVAAHPDLEMPEACRELLPNAERLRDPDSPLAHLLREGTSAATDADRQRGEVLCGDLLATLRGGWRSWALVPARGLLQPGWLTSLFLHAGWLHLLGNLFFFVMLVGPFLEDVWGWKYFLAFYLLGGLFAGLAQAVMSWGSEIPILGASGAIAACMGAFSLRFASRRVKFFYWLHLRWYGTFLLPAWVYGIFWIGSEILNLVTYGDGAGVAFMAHIGGFGFGFGTAVALKVFRLEERFIQPSLDAADGLWKQHPGVAAGYAALAEGRREEARAAFESVVAADATNQDAHLALARMDFDEGDDARGTRRLDGVFSRWLAQQQEENIRAVIDELHAHIDASALRPALAYRLARMEAKAERYTAAFAFLIAVGRSAAPNAIAARLEAAELAAGPIHDLHLAREMARELLAEPLEPALQDRVQAILQATGGAGSTSTDSLVGAAAPAAALAPRAAASPPPPAPDLRARATLCRVAARTPQGPRMILRDGREGLVAWSKIVGVVVGHVDAGPDSAGEPLPQAIIDLVASWGGPGQPPTVVRLCDPQLSFGQLFDPPLDEPQAVAAFLREVLEQSGARAWPSPESVLRGPWPMYPDTEALEAAAYPAAR
ncbi:MAG: rhomboid family intramembrane serine protease [Deltaproteobacteria bacterium]|nr:rhomboid family intramembrane serine protease [Deltaproteobacteria bacterium]